ncbi:MAG TPA: ABC transporter substrate-binding protein [Candidatus Nanopelagicales bacterium]|jgi:putative spermidine/putrescine transport system substrate-binding protein
MATRRLLKIAVVGAAVAMVATGCGSSSGTTDAGSGPAKPPQLPMLQALGAGEGAINILAWPGYAENGTTDPSVNWVTPFEKATGCKANVQVANTSDEMFEKMGTGDFDVVSASGDSSLRMIYAGKVAPVNTTLLTNWNDIASFQKGQQWNSVGGVNYGIPHGWGANLLSWRTDKVTPAPDSWSMVWDTDSPYKGKIGAYDSPTYLADAALYLMSTKPDLGIKNPYALDQKQFEAAVALATAQKPILAGYWSSYTDAQKAFTNGTFVLGTSWQIIVNLAKADKAPVDAVLPKEGSTGWADTWMIDAKSPHPNCAYMWMNWITTPKIQAQVAEWFGEAPANTKACDFTVDKSHCDIFHAKDEAYFKRIWFWATPQADCLDGRTDVKCVPYSQWTQAWSQLRS